MSRRPVEQAWRPVLIGMAACLRDFTQGQGRRRKLGTCGPLGKLAPSFHTSSSSPQSATRELLVNNENLTMGSSAQLLLISPQQWALGPQDLLQNL